MAMLQRGRRLDLAEVESSESLALRRVVVKEYLGFRGLPPSLLYAKAGSQDCPSRKVEIGSISNKP
jgi:hypothetical protein